MSEKNFEAIRREKAIKTDKSTIPLDFSNHHFSKNIFPEIQSYLMTQMGYGCSVEGYERKIRSAICRGYYGSISSVIIEVEGSPVRGRAIVWSDSDFNKNSNQIFHITIQQKEGRFKSYKKFYYQKDDNNIFSKILNLAISEAQK